jgi:hypothetical protein
MAPSPGHASGSGAACGCVYITVYYWVAQGAAAVASVARVSAVCQPRLTPMASTDKLWGLPGAALCLACNTSHMSCWIWMSRLQHPWHLKRMRILSSVPHTLKCNCQEYAGVCISCGTHNYAGMQHKQVSWQVTDWSAYTHHALHGRLAGVPPIPCRLSVPGMQCAHIHRVTNMLTHTHWTRSQAPPACWLQSNG